MLAKLRNAWDVLAAAIAAGAAAYWLTPATLDKITAELITFFGIQAAVILPAMIFTAAILRPEGLSLPEAKRYRAALRSQMIFWVVLLALDFMTVGSLILGKATAWTITGTLPWLGWRFNASGALMALTAFLGTIAILRTIPFIKGVMSLQSINADLTEKAILARDHAATAEPNKVAESTPFRSPKGFGRVVNRH